MTVNRKLFVGLGVILLTVIVLGGSGIWNMMRSLQLIEAVGASARETMQLANAQNALWQLRYGIPQFILFTDKTARDRIVADEVRWYKEIDENLSAFRSGHHNAEEMAALNKLQDVFKQFKDARPKWFQLYGEWKLEEAAEWHSKTMAPFGAATIAGLSSLIQLQQESAGALERSAVRQTAALRILLIVLVVITIIVLLLVAYLIVNAIAVPLNKALGMANQVAAGDLTATVEITSLDEFGALLSALKSMNENLTHMVSDIRGGAESIRKSANEVAAGNTNLSQRTEEQASTLEETASSMEELTSAVRENTQSAEDANALAQKAKEVAARGGTVVGAVVVTMNEIQESSKKIGDITGVIDSIAFQTNILALNAAVEAARAGEQGRGFAVVASEVRALAQRSADAAKEIKALISSSVQRVAAGTHQVEDAGKTMREIVASVEKVAAIIDQISSASRQQADGIEQVNRAVGQMDQVVQQNAAVVEQAAAASESMQSSAQQLVDSVSVFKLRDMPAMHEPVRRTPSSVAAIRTTTATPRLLQPNAGVVPSRLRGVAGDRILPPKADDGDWKEF
ncbi:MAG: methyl-accepting chemotaxis protein [Burkholderiales bacterium]